MKFKRIIAALCCILLVLALSSCSIISQPVTPDGNLALHVIDVGQGDSILVKLPDGKNMLIDGGTRKMEDRVVQYLRDQKIVKVDYLIATHPHEDHIGGLIKVIQTFEIGSIYMPDKEHTSKTFSDLLDAIEDKGYKMKRAKAGVKVAEGEGLRAYFTAPVKDGYKSLNDYSAVLKIEFGQIGILLAGDAEALSEGEMLQSGASLKSHILKVGHHGSNTSSSQEFLNAVSPKYAVISNGADNSYGHPHKEVLTRLKNMGIEIFTTEKNGTVVFITDGKNIYKD